jgi:hypothetical protein
MTKSLKTLSPEELKIADSHAGFVHLVSGKTATGEDFYAYISVLPSRYEEFMLISRAREEMNLHEFGRVLEAGFGKEPPRDVQEDMAACYHIDPLFMKKIRHAADDRAFYPGDTF